MRMLTRNQGLITCGEHFKAHLVHDGLSRLEETWFAIGRIPGAKSRTYAATSIDGKKILISPKLARLPMDVRRGIIMHELGHAVDFLYPAQIVLGRGDHGRDIVVHEDEPTRVALSRHAHRDDDEIERFADSIAERAFGVRIGYRGRCLLQSDQGGIRPRPRGLR